MKKILAALESDRKTLILAVVIFVFAIYLDYAFVIGWQKGLLNVSEKKVQKINAEISALMQDLARMRSLQKKQQELGKSGFKKVITEDEVSLLLRDISNMANASNVKVVQIKPLRSQSPPKAEDGAYPLNISLELLCAYHALGSFINRLEDAEQIMEVAQLKVLPQAENYFYQQVSLILKTYVKK